MENTDLEKTTTKVQENRKEKKKTIILTLILSLFLIGGVGTWVYYALFSEYTRASEIDLPSKDDVAEAEKTSGTAIYKPTIKVPVTEIQKRINRMHEYWNSKLGFGAWEKYSIDANHEQLTIKAQQIREDILPYATGPLKTDIETALNKMEMSLKTKDIDTLKGVHRIFHDLDITLNGYQSASEYWEVTETWKWLQKSRE